MALAVAANGSSNYSELIMNIKEVVNMLLGAPPAELRELFALLHAEFAKKAEAIYDANPEENGLIAQPYADISDSMHEASAAFEEPEQMTLADEPEEAPATVTQAVEARAKVNPWGQR